MDVAREGVVVFRDPATVLSASTAARTANWRS
jgi:hypothetical protein